MKATSNPAAFPLEYTVEGQDAQTGMSLRDYFAAHAPEEPERWFENIWLYDVQMPREPEGAAYCDGCKGDGDCEKSEACLAMRDFQQRKFQWLNDRDRAKAADWRFMWADSMLERRDKHTENKI